MKKISLLIMTAALGILFTACEKKGAPALGEKAKYTVILYANGGENLDHFIEEDIAKAAEFLNTKGNDYSVRMVTYMKYSSQQGLDGQENYVPGGAADAVYRYEVGYDCYRERADKEQYLALPDEWIVDNVEAPMFTPSYLSDVLKDAAKNVPAENYILIIAGHANGWCVETDGEYPEPNKKHASAMTDAYYGGRAITAKDLASGIRQAGLNLTTVIFDCCMQNSIEYLSELTDVPGLQYTIASGHSTHGGDYSYLLQELFDVTAGKKDYVKALGNYAEKYAQAHKEDYDAYHDVVLMNVDFAVVDLKKLPAAWAPIKNIVDYLCTNYKASDSAKYVLPSRYCYQYYNNDIKVDLTDYLTLMKAPYAPYENDAQYASLLEAVETSMKNCILHHAFALNYEDERTIPKDQVKNTLTMNINLGAKGRIQKDFKGNNGFFLCYDYEGNPWEFYPNSAYAWQRSNTENVMLYNWKYSYDKSTFNQNTGWSNWLKLNPVMPYDNPPMGDEGDTNE